MFFGNVSKKKDVQSLIGRVEVQLVDVIVVEAGRLSSTLPPRYVCMYFE
jgi:hypothetical protein